MCGGQETVKELDSEPRLSMGGSWKEAILFYKSSVASCYECSYRTNKEFLG